MKKIATVVLSIALILMFVACEATTPTFYGKKVSSVTVASAPVYFKGDTIDPADVTLRVVYDDNTERTVNAAEAGLIPVKDGSYIAGEDVTKFQVVYGEDIKGNLLTWNISIPTTKPTGDVVINTENAVKTIYKGTVLADIDFTGVTYSVAYKGGSKVVTGDTYASLAKGALELKYSDDNKTATISVISAAADSVSLSAPWTLTVEDDPSKIIDTVELRWNDSQEFYYVNGTYRNYGDANASAATLENVDYKVIAHYHDGSEKEISAKVDFTDTATTQKLNAKTINNFPAEVTIKGANADGTDLKKTATLTIEYTEDYVLTFSVEKSNSNGIKPGDPIKELDFTFTAESWASGKEYKDDEASMNILAAANFDILPDNVKLGATTAVPTADISVVVKDNAEYKCAKAVWDGVAFTIPVASN